MKKYSEIYKHYESCFEQHGDTSKGVDWPNEDDARIRYRVMLDVVDFDPEMPFKTWPSLLDFGCGLSHFYEYLEEEGPDFHYTGVDISEKFIEESRKKFPLNEYHCVDVLEENTLPTADYTIANGVFTEKRSMTYQEMFDYMCEVLCELWKVTNKAMAFNVMSKNVDWERDDLFHVSMDELSAFVCEKLSRNFVIRNDYGLYEYTMYVYR